MMTTVSIDMREKTKLLSASYVLVRYLGTRPSQPASRASVQCEASSGVHTDSQSVGQQREPRKNDRADRDSVWDIDSRRAQTTVREM